jgi:2-dehydro-3-deoxyphosphogluconate aldolase/(4S)-4-hydroxy-2-oxoglutarate aldolase
VVAIVRGGSGRRTAAVLDTIVDAGLTCVEVTLNTPGAIKEITEARRRCGAKAEIGAGTVRSARQAQAALAAGAQFLVSPHVGVDIARVARSAGVPYYPGAFTATEISSAWDAAAAAVKVFPSGLGGVPYLRAIRGPLDDVPLIPTGGVNPSVAEELIAAGAFAVGAGGWLIGDALDDDGDLRALANRASALRDAAGGRSK